MKKLIDRLFSDKNITNYLNCVIRYRFAILIVTGVLTAGAVMLDTKIGVNSSIMALLPKDTPSVKRVNELEKKTGGLGDLIVMIESPSKEDNISAADKLLTKIRKLEWVDRAGYRLNDSVFVRNKLLFIDSKDLEEIRDRVKKYISDKYKSANPLFVSIFDEAKPTLDFSDIEKKYSGAENYQKINISDNGDMLLIVIHPHGITSNIGFAKSIYNDLKNVVTQFKLDNQGTVKISIGGTYRNRLDEYETIMRDLSSGTLLSVLIILLLLFIYFRRFSLILCILLPLIMSEAWTFAITVLSIGDLNLITAFLIIILFGLGIDFGIHLINRYMIQRREGADHFSSMKTAIQKSGRASLTSAMTIIISFYMLMFSDFLGFRHFGFIAGTGILLAYIAYMVILPAILTIANDLTGGLKILPLKQKSPSLTNTQKTATTLVKPPEPFPVSQIVLVICICITAICVWKTMNVSFEYDFRNLRSQIPSTREFNQKMRKVFKAARDPAAVMIKNEQDEKNVRRYLEENNLLTIQSPVEDVKSIDDLIPADQDQKLQILQEIRHILDQNRQNLSNPESTRIDAMSKLLVDSPMTKSDIPEEILKLFQGTPGSDGQLMYLYQRNSLLDLHNAEKFSNAVGKMSIDNHNYYAVSEPLVYVDLIKLLKRDSIFAIIGAFLIIAIIIFFDFGKVRSTLIILSSLCIGLVWMLGIMGIFSLKLNIFNMVILPSILGLGVDAAVHIYHSFDDKFGSPIGKLLIETGGPNILCTLINLVGFGGIITAVHPGLQSIGKLAIIGMSTCLVSALCIIPMVLVLLKKRRAT